MTTMELTHYKMQLLREIINDFNTESALSKLGTACHFIKNEEAMKNLPAMPTHLLEMLMSEAIHQDAEGLSMDEKELEKEMQTW